MNNIRHNWLAIAGVVAVLVAINGLFFYFSPETVVAYIGVENTYITILLIAALGGLNSLTSGVFYSSLVAFSAGGANPLLLGLFGGFGIAVGDVLMFSLFTYGYRSVHKATREKVEQYVQWVKKYPRWVQYGFVYIYLAFSPFPNDILMLSLAILNFSYKTVIPLVILGGITIATLLAYGGSWWFIGT